MICIMVAAGMEYIIPGYRHGYRYATNNIYPAGYHHRVPGYIHGTSKLCGQLKLNCVDSDNIPQDIYPYFYHKFIV